MKIIKAYVEQMTPAIDGAEFLKTIEKAGRVCYKSEEKITETYRCPTCGDNKEVFQWTYGAPYDENDTPSRLCSRCRTPLVFDGSAVDFVAKLIKNGHEAMLEHGPDISIKFVCDRGVSHEIVRHRLFSFAQESTRYCNYGKEDEITVIEPCFWQHLNIEHSPKNIWRDLMIQAEYAYITMLKHGVSPQEGRSVLPNSLKTEIIVKGNPREWRHFFKLRTAKSAHPQMQEVANMALEMLKEQIPVVFDDI